LLGRRKIKKREIKTQKPMYNVGPITCIGFRVFIFLFSISLLSSTPLKSVWFYRKKNKEKKIMKINE
jgi:hypothetical protein